MKLSVIIVNYNVTELLRKCLRSIDTFAQGFPYEIIVVDNCSPDESWKNLIKEFSAATFIESKENNGFAVANNIAVAHAAGEFLLLLNPDTELLDNQLVEVLNFAETQENFGCLGVQMRDAKGDFLPESKRSVPDVLNSFEKLFVNFRKSSRRSYYRNDISENAVAPVDVVTGAFLLLRRQVYLQIGGLDERYFMYGEDIDLCYTLLQHGYQNWYYGKVSILHHKGESTVKNDLYLKRFYGAMQIFIDKYYRPKNLFSYYLLSLGLRFRHRLERRRLN